MLPAVLDQPISVLAVLSGPLSRLPNFPVRAVASSVRRGCRRTAVCLLGLPTQCPSPSLPNQVIHRYDNNSRAAFRPHTSFVTPWPNGCSNYQLARPVDAVVSLFIKFPGGSVCLPPMSVTPSSLLKLRFFITTFSTFLCSFSTPRCQAMVVLHGMAMENASRWKITP